MKAEIGIIGGSGFYEFLKGREVLIKTPFGLPSDKILLTEYDDRKIAFLPRHGKKHQYPPHKINYRANLWALKNLGCQRLIAPAAVGSLSPKIKPGDFVICDQLIDRTKNRPDTFFDGPVCQRLKPQAMADRPKVVHISLAEPYCPEMRKITIKACKKLNLSFHQKGAVVVIEGPRFSTKAESMFYSRTADVINMTQYPEIVLARELEICYVNISLVTDYDAGLKNRKDVKPVTTAEVLKIFQQNNKKVKGLILAIIKNLPRRPACLCRKALEKAGV